MNYLVYLAIIPSIILGLYIYKNDSVEKEPVGLLFRNFVGGILSGIIVIVIALLFPYKITDSILNIAFYSFIIVALIEEGFKFFFTYFLAYRDREFNYMYDGICYASFVSLGFATLENILYAINSPDFITILSRCVITVPAHIFFAIFMGYYLGIAKYYRVNNKKQEENINIVKAFVIPILLHGMFDFVLIANNSITSILFIILVGTLYFVSFKKVKLMGNIRVNLYE